MHPRTLAASFASGVSTETSPGSGRFMGAHMGAQQVLTTARLWCYNPGQPKTLLGFRRRFALGLVRE